ncbi:hypothetical protein K3495_g6261 [Podosphaera aphanis]|nr:hypothetical protein K3495_g6261 [Podosphaera aphanis]
MGEILRIITLILLFYANITVSDAVIQKRNTSFLAGAYRCGTKIFSAEALHAAALDLQKRILSDPSRESYARHTRTVPNSFVGLEEDGDEFPILWPLPDLKQSLLVHDINSPLIVF